MERKIFFPFTAVVGQEKAKLALLCCAVDPMIGGVLLAGDKGTGKSTLVRALSQVLPEIEVSDCPFNCNPRNPLEMCDSCYEAMQSGKIRIVKRKMRVIDLPLSITVDRLVGTLDIKRALTEGIRALQPGLLAEANNNILYIDEVNLLDDYVADLLLDAAAMGWNIIEREGISVKHPARFILVGSMNPEEGELRPQLLDRFGLYVSIEASKDPEERAEIVRRAEEFRSDPLSFYNKYRQQEEALRDSIKKARKLVSHVTIDDDLLRLLAETIINLGIRTHRAEITTVRTAKAIAALEGRTKVSLEDLKRAMELTLPHRIKSSPLEPPRPPSLPPLPQEGQRESRPRSEGAPFKNLNHGSQGKFDEQAKGERERTFEAAEVQVNLNPERKRSPQSKHLNLRGSKIHRTTVIGYPHGYPISYTLPKRTEDLRDIDLAATLNAAACRQRCLPLVVEEGDLRIKIRKRLAPHLSVIVLDSSGSMGVQRRMMIAKGIAKSLIENSYKKRDLVSLIVFRGQRAEVIVPPTRKYSDILEAIDKVPTGGRTPLPSALHQLLLLAKSFKTKCREGAVKGIIITDGKGNVPLYSTLESDIRALSSALAKSGVEIEIHDTRPSAALELAPSYIKLMAEITNAQVYQYN